MAEYFASGQNKKYDRIATSDVILIAIGKIQKAEDEGQLDEWVKKTYTTRMKGDKKRYRIDQEDPIMDQTIKRLLRTKAIKKYL